MEFKHYSCVGILLDADENELVDEQDVNTVPALLAIIGKYVWMGCECEPLKGLW